ISKAALSIQRQKRPAFRLPKCAVTREPARCIRRRGRNRGRMRDAARIDPRGFLAKQTFPRKRIRLRGYKRLVAPASNRLRRCGNRLWKLDTHGAFSPGGSKLRW